MSIFTAWGLVATPNETGMAEARAEVQKEAEVATVLNPLNREIKIRENGGAFGPEVSIVVNGQEKPVGYLMAVNFTHPELGAPTPRQELLKMVASQKYAYRFVGMDGKRFIVAFASPEDMAKLELAELMQPIQETAKNSGLTNEEITERVIYMKAMGCSNENIVKILNMYQPVADVQRPHSLYQAVEEKDIEGEIISETVIVRMIRNIIMGNAILLEGPKSTGKNVAWETVAWLCNRQLHSMTMNSEVTKEELFGMYTTDNEPAESLNEANTASFLDFVKAAFKSVLKHEKEKEAEKSSQVRYIMNVIKTMGTTLKFAPGFVTQVLANGGQAILLFDEMNMARANILTAALNSITDGHSKYLYIPGMGQVPIPENLIIGGTQNGAEDGAMTGIQLQNEATLSRFVIIRMTPSTGTMVSVFEEAVPEAKKETLEKADRIYGFIRDSYLAGAISGKAVSPRSFIKFIKNVENGQPVKNALLECVLNQIQDEMEEKAILSSLRQDGIL